VHALMYAHYSFVEGELSFVKISEFLAGGTLGEVSFDLSLAFSLDGTFCSEDHDAKDMIHAFRKEQ